MSKHEAIQDARRDAVSIVEEHESEILNELYENNNITHDKVFDSYEASIESVDGSPPNDLHECIDILEAFDSHTDDCEIDHGDDWRSQIRGLAANAKAKAIASYAEELLENLESETDDVAYKVFSLGVDLEAAIDADESEEGEESSQVQELRARHEEAKKELRDIVRHELDHWA